MKLQGNIILGTGGDNSEGAEGTFFEGAMTSSWVDAETDAAIQASIVAAGYGSTLARPLKADDSAATLEAAGGFR